MSWWTTARAVGAALGIPERRLVPVGCARGRSEYTETKRASQIVNVLRPGRPLSAATIARLQPWFPHLDLHSVRVRTGCRLPPNRFQERGRIYAMTFGSTIYWRDELDERNPNDLVRLMHELVHVDQQRRHGGESAFACAYGEGYVSGGGQVPAHISAPTAYHRNPLEAEAYAFEARFRDSVGRVIADRIDRAPEPR
ncbi:MAG TPA: DUF4157 domain-containing protein [Ilumatobacter sp.]|nr:DUF4157 domain-containing protein [Ilumatobacter sp.]